jgi:predicted lipoprotein
MASVTPHKLSRLKHVAWPFALVLLWAAAPPFHVRRLDAADASSEKVQRAVFDPALFAPRFWSETLQPMSSQSVDAAKLLEVLQLDEEAAAQRYGRRAGLGGPAFYLVRGEGRVAGVDRKGVRLELSSGGTVLLMTGPLFGNALRDATGLIEIQQFTSFEFNALSTELNRIAETRVQPILLERARPDTRLRFTGCGEYGEAGELKIIAIEVANAS